MAVGIREAEFTIVGTYPVADAYGVQQSLAKKSGESSFSAPRKGLAVYSTSHPTNVYFAYPDSERADRGVRPVGGPGPELISSGGVGPSAADSAVRLLARLPAVLLGRSASAAGCCSRRLRAAAAWAAARPGRPVVVLAAQFATLADATAGLAGHSWSRSRRWPASHPPWRGRP